MRIARLFIWLALTLTAACSCAGAASAPPKHFNMLVFSKTTGFRHDSIPDGVRAIQQLGRDHRFTVAATEDAGTFTARRLARYDVVIFLSTTGTPIARRSQQHA